MDNYLKWLVFISVFLVFFIIAPYFIYSYAQEATTSATGCFILNQSDLPSGTPLPDGCDSGGGVSGSCGSVVDWDNKIVAKLIPGVQGLYNNLPTQIKSNCASTTPPPWFEDMYWCTYSVVDAYNLAGLKGMTTADDGAVISMHKFFMQQQNGYVYVEYEKASNHLAALQQVKPGYAMMLEASYLQ